MVQKPSKASVGKMRQKGANWLMRQPIVKEEITTALMALLKQKPYREIKVTDVVEKAGVCRASFYRNYLTMYKVIDEAVSHLFSGIFQGNTMSQKN